MPCKQTSIAECIEEINEFLKHKNPQVKFETLRWLIRCLRETRICPTKPEQKTVAEACSKLLGDTSEPVRSSAAEAMGTLMKIIGERGMNPYLEGLDDIRKTKIKEFFELAVVKAKEKPPAPPAAAKAPPKKGPLGKRPPAKASGGVPPPPKKEGTVPSKLAAPKPAAPGGLKLQKKPPGAAAPSAISPPSPKRAPPSPVEDEPPTVPKMGFSGRGLTSRPLAATQPQPQSQPGMKFDTGLSAADKAELEQLRNEKEQWLRGSTEEKAERTKLLQQINDLQMQVSIIHTITSENVLTTCTRMPN